MLGRFFGDVQGFVFVRIGFFLVRVGVFVRVFFYKRWVSFGEIWGRFLVTLLQAPDFGHRVKAHNLFLAISVVSRFGVAFEVRIIDSHASVWHFKLGLWSPTLQCAPSSCGYGQPCFSVPTRVGAMDS